MPPPSIIAGTFLSSLLAASYFPRDVLPIVALLGSTITLQWSADEYYFLSAWEALHHDRPRSKGGDQPYQYLQLGRWYHTWSETWGTMFPIVALPMTWISGLRLAAFHYLTGSKREILWAYIVGVGLAIAHMPAGQKAFPLVGRLRRAGQDYQDASKDKDDIMMKDLQTWTGMHWKRTLIVDVPAVVAFATGLYLTLLGP